MKKLLSIALLFGTLTSLAQQDPYYTHFKDIKQAYNPAAAGEKKGEICLSGLSHFQWRDYDDVTFIRGTDGNLAAPAIENVAPITYNLNVATLFGLGKSGDNFLGVGITAIQDQVGFTQATTIMGQVNYKKHLQGGFQVVSAGFGIGGQQFGFVNPQFKFRDPNDPNIPITGGSEMKLDLSFGAMFEQERLGSFENFYAGLSATHLNGAEYQITTTSGLIERKYEPHYYALVGAEYPMGTITLEPAFLAKYAFIGSQYKPQFDVNVTGLYAETFRGGIAYRQYGNADATSLLIGYVKNALQIGYSYDITLSSIQSVSNGTHEVMVKYCIPITVADPPEKIKRLTPRFL